MTTAPAPVSARTTAAMSETMTRRTIPPCRTAWTDSFVAAGEPPATYDESRAPAEEPSGLHRARRPRRGARDRGDARRVPPGEGACGRHPQQPRRRVPRDLDVAQFPAAHRGVASRQGRPCRFLDLLVRELRAHVPG